MAKIFVENFVFQPKRKKSAEWAGENPILRDGEFGVVTDGTDGEWLKVGDGVTAWNSLPYKKGPKGDKGDNGDDGYTPQKGIDYFTDEDIAGLNIPSVDQTYTPDSENAQSGKAVAQALKDKQDIIMIPVNGFTIDTDFLSSYGMSSCFIATSNIELKYVAGIDSSGNKSIAKVYNTIILKGSTIQCYQSDVYEFALKISGVLRGHLQPEIIWLHYNINWNGMTEGYTSFYLREESVFQDITSRVNNISASSTYQQYPSAKAVFNYHDATKQDILTAGDNITIDKNNVISVSSGVFHPTDSIMWKEPKNFGKKVNGVIGDNIKLYRDVYDETFVFIGSGEMYDATNYNDPYLYECGLGGGSSTARNIVIQEGITSIGYYVFNRIYTIDYSYMIDNSNVKEYGPISHPDSYVNVGNTIRTLVIPKSVSRLVGRSFQYCHISNKIIINCDSNLIIQEQAFEGAWFDTIEIPNAISISGYGNNTFSTQVLKNFSIGQDNCQFQTSVSFSNCSKLTANSLINIANHLKLISSDETAQTLTLHATPKTLCTNTKGEIADGVFVKNASGTVTLTDFITNTKGWTIA